MQNEQEPGAPSPARRVTAARPAPRSGGLSVTKVVLAAIVLLLLAWFIGNRPSKTPGSEEAAISPAEVGQDSPASAVPSGAVVLQGEKSTTLATIDDARMSVDPQGQVLRITGNVGRNFAKDLQTALEASPSLQRIDITSGGGYGGPGLDAARMIRRRNLIVRVQSHCASMCVALWAAGAQRQMEPDAMIGLHAWNAQCDARPSPEREECHYQMQFATDYDASYDAWLRGAGFSQKLLELQSSTASEDIAILTPLQLWEGGVDFSVVDRDGTRMSRDEVQRYLAEKTTRR
jgi:alkylhydroperoxidase family enzyme